MSDGRTPLLSGVRIPATVLFADIRGFTRLADRLPANIVVQMLDEYFEAMSAAARTHGAMIDKLIGDAIMLLYGIPTPRRDEALHVALTTDEMHRRFAALAARWRRRTRVPRLGLGIGAASGEVVLANVGSVARMDYTVIGAPVNLAARLTGAATSGQTLVDATLRNQLVGSAAAEVIIGRARRLALKGFRGYSIAHTCRLRRSRPIAAYPSTAVDPVCGMKVEVGAALTVMHRGESYFFCSTNCADAFSANPTIYLGQRRR